MANDKPATATPTDMPTAGREAAWIEIHPLVVRIAHWINAFAILIMVASGLRIHNAEPILPFKFANEMNHDFLAYYPNNRITIA